MLYRVIMFTLLLSAGGLVAAESALTELSDAELHAALTTASRGSKEGNQQSMQELEVLTVELERRKTWASRYFLASEPGSAEREQYRDNYARYIDMESTVVNTLADYDSAGLSATLEDVADVIAKDPTSIADPKTLARNLLLKKFENDYVARLRSEGVPTAVAQSYWGQVMSEEGFTDKLDASIDDETAQVLANGADYLGERARDQRLKDLLNSGNVLEKARVLNRIAGPFNVLQDGMDAYLINQQLGMLHANDENVIEISRRLRGEGLDDQRITQYFSNDSEAKKELLLQVTPESAPVSEESGGQESRVDATGESGAGLQRPVDYAALGKLHAAYGDGGWDGRPGGYSSADIKRYHADAKYRNRTEFLATLYRYGQAAAEALQQEQAQQTGEWSSELPCGSVPACAVRVRDTLRQKIFVPTSLEQLAYRNGLEQADLELYYTFFWYEAGPEYQNQDYRDAVRERYSEQKIEEVWSNWQTISGVIDMWKGIETGNPGGFIQDELRRLGYVAEDHFGEVHGQELLGTLRPILQMKPLRQIEASGTESEPELFEGPAGTPEDAVMQPPADFGGGFGH